MAAWRNLSRSKMFTLVNISGLAVGLGVFILIMLWVNNEMSYNSFDAGKERMACRKGNKAESKLFRVLIFFPLVG